MIKLISYCYTIERKKNIPGLSFIAKYCNANKNEEGKRKTKSGY